jgi:hypothetical protein
MMRSALCTGFVGFTVLQDVRPERKSLAGQQTVNRSLTEHAQFVNQSEPLSIGLAQRRVSSPNGGRHRIRRSHGPVKAWLERSTLNISAVNWTTKGG